MPFQAPDLINRERYPIDVADHEQRAAAVGEVRARLEEDGCAVARDFLSRAGQTALLG